MGNEIMTWNDLLSVIKTSAIREDPLAASDLRLEFGYHIDFVLLFGEANNPSYFEDIPFTPITQGIVEEARRYVDAPRVPHAFAVVGATLPPDRYRIRPGERSPEVGIAREINPLIDALIVSVAQCLEDRGTFDLRDTAGIGRAANDVLRHYRNIPVVRFFCVLPYLESVIYSRKLSPVEGLITVYKGIEGLLMEIWEELGQREVITDEHLTNKARQKLRTKALAS